MYEGIGGERTGHIKVPIIPDALRFLTLTADVARQDVKVISFPGKYLIVKTTVPLRLRFRSDMLEVDCVREWRHSFEEVFVTHLTQVGGKIEFAYADAENLSVGFDDYDTKVYRIDDIENGSPLSWPVPYPPWMKTLHVGLAATGAVDISVTQNVFNAPYWPGIIGIDNILQPTIRVKDTMFSYNLPEGDQIIIAAEPPSGTVTCRLWLRFRKW